MTLVRVWRRQLIGGMGTAAIVPMALLASLAALALAGGFGGLSALGQAFSGPSLPGSPLAAGNTRPSAGALPRALAATLSSLPARRAAPGSSGSVAPAGAATPAAVSGSTGT